MIEMDKRLLVHEIEYSEYDGLDRYKQPSYKEPITITDVRVDESTVFSRDTTQSKVLANAVVFVYNGLSVPFIDFKEQSKVVYNGREYITQRIIPIYEPYTNELFSYEIEVL